MKRILSVLLALALMMTLAIPASADACIDFFYGKGTKYYLNYPTQEQIIEKARELNIDFSFKDTFSSDYNLNSPNYAPGMLSDETRQNALNVLNFFRYVAGLPSDVQLSDEYAGYAQAGALVLAANGKLSHEPDIPSGMNEALYKIGYNGCASGNISVGYGNLSKSVADAWMNDSAKNNIKTAGHRRWILYPNMQYTDFGEVDRYTTMYAHDMSRQGCFADEFVAWPAPNTPVEMFPGSLFTFSLGYEYDDPDESKINIEVTSETLGKTWHVSSSHPCVSFSTDKLGYGLPKCILFKVADFTEPDTIHVKITGTTKGGKDAPIEYTANLFSVSQVQTEQELYITRPYYGFQSEVTVSSLLDSDPQIEWESTDTRVVNMYGDIVYPFREGDAYLIGRYGGASVKLRVVISNSDILLGDADGDGEITITDATVIQRAVVGMTPFSYYDYAADTDEDDDISSSDVTQLQRYISGIPANRNIGKVMQPAL